MKKLSADFQYLPDMYGDEYFPTFLVDKVKAEIQKLVVYIEQGNRSKGETVGREDIAATVEKILQFFEIDIDIEEAIRERDW